MIKDFVFGFIEGVGPYGLGFMAGQMATFFVLIFIPVAFVVWIIAYNRSQDKTPRVK